MSKNIVVAKWPNPWPPTWKDLYGNPPDDVKYSHLRAVCTTIRGYEYSSGKDPVQQVLHYVKRLKEERSVPDLRGRAIRGINAGTAFHCYIVVDLLRAMSFTISI